MERYRIQSEAAVYFVTYSVVDWLPVFVSEGACSIVTESLNFCHQEKGLRVNAYVVMPTHLHAIVFDKDYDCQRLERSLADLRKFTGRRLGDFCSGHMPPCFAETLRAQASADRERRFWQPSRHAEALQSERFWKQKLDYLHGNPCRKGLVIRAEHWRFSSASFHLSDGQQPCDVPISAILW